jgi:hypothetical protein
MVELLVDELQHGVHRGVTRVVDVRHHELNINLTRPVTAHTSQLEAPGYRRFARTAATPAQRVSRHAMASRDLARETLISDVREAVTCRHTIRKHAHDSASSRSRLQGACYAMCRQFDGVAERQKRKTTSHDSHDSHMVNYNDHEHESQKTSENQSFAARTPEVVADARTICH